MLVTCAGFEDRSLHYLREAVRRGSSGFRVVCLDYLPVVSQNRGEELRTLAETAGATIVAIQYDRENPGHPGSSLLEAAADCSRILIDVSGMSRLLIVQMISALIRANRIFGVQIIYTEAKEYPPSREEVEASLLREDDVFGIINFVSSGVFGIIVPAELSSVAMYDQPIRLVVFPTFNPSQFAALRAEINSSAFTIVHGTPHHPDLSWRTTAIRTINNVDKLRECEERTTSTFDYRETISLLVQLYQRDCQRNKLIISPTGSKMQSVAVGVVVGFLPDLQVVYPAPRSFPSPERYTSGVLETYGLDMSFLAVGAAELYERAQREDGLSNPA